MDRAIAKGAVFRCDIRWVTLRVLLVEYAGDVPDEEEHVRKTEEMLGLGALPVALCFDLTEMRSFHRAQVALHVRMFARLAPRVPAIALVGAGPAARFAAVTVSLTSKLALRTFESQGDAIAWLDSLVDVRRSRGRDPRTHGA